MNKIPTCYRELWQFIIEKCWCGDSLNYWNTIIIAIVAITVRVMFIVIVMIVVWLSSMVTSEHANAIHITSPLWGESTGDLWRVSPRANAKLWFLLLETNSQGRVCERAGRKNGLIQMSPMVVIEKINAFLLYTLMWVVGKSFHLNETHINQYRHKEDVCNAVGYDRLCVFFIFNGTSMWPFDFRMSIAVWKKHSIILGPKKLFHSYGLEISIKASRRSHGNH